MASKNFVATFGICFYLIHKLDQIRIFSFFLCLDTEIWAKAKLLHVVGEGKGKKRSHQATTVGILSALEVDIAELGVFCILSIWPSKLREIAIPARIPIYDNRRNEISLTLAKFCCIQFLYGQLNKITKPKYYLLFFS